MLESFKSEIVEAENDRNELLKWKVIIVAALMAVGLGVGELGNVSNSETKPYILLVLCIVPLVCVYTDLLCIHLQIRILVISKFFQDYQIKDSDSIKHELEIFKSYEVFCEKKRSVFSFEDWAQTGSTYVLCTLICIASFIALVVNYNPNLFYLISFGVLGIISTALIDRTYDKKKRKLNCVD